MKIELKKAVIGMAGVSAIRMSQIHMNLLHLSEQRLTEEESEGMSLCVEELQKVLEPISQVLEELQKVTDSMREESSKKKIRKPRRLR